MLSRLSITNYALIKSLEMEAHAELNIITGETGAGKSIMLGAVGLLLGNRADTKVLYDQEQKCIIEGEFHISAYGLNDQFTNFDLDYDDVTLIRREITPAGKSRAFVNDTPVNLEVLKEIGSRLMDIHSQHQTLLLGSVNYQLKIIDTYAGSGKELADYKMSFLDYKSAVNRLRELQSNADRLSQESDYNKFLLDELEEANLVVDEQGSLEEELKILEHAEEIKTNLVQILSHLERNEPNLLAMLQESRQLSGQVSNFSEPLALIHERLNAAYIELNDILSEVENQESLLEVDHGRTEEVRDRISILYHLQNKHHVDNITGLIQLKERLEKETFLANNLGEEIEKAKQKLTDAEEKTQKLGKVLRAKRSKIFEPLKMEVVQLLQQLGMPDAKMEISLAEKDPGDSGLDEIAILFSANRGVAPAPLNKVASGGEFSRLMFCFKYIMADKTSLPTMVFDEIDAGISGEVALQMGNMIQKMAKSHQVITISHLAQIAARGQAHYFVYKATEDQRSVSKIKKLSNEEKIEEVAKMISGANPSPSSYSSAKELIALSL